LFVDFLWAIVLSVFFFYLRFSFLFGIVKHFLPSVSIVLSLCCIVMSELEGCWVRLWQVRW